MVLTGAAATESLQLYMRLGAAGARFDRSRIAAAMRSRAGRARLLFALNVRKALGAAVRSKVGRATGRPRRAAVTRQRGIQRLAAAPDRPALLAPLRGGGA